MKWEEIRKLYPDQYIKLKILDYYLENNRKIVTDVALINVIEDSKLATKELLNSKGNTIVYHTGTDRIVIELRTPTGHLSL